VRSGDAVLMCDLIKTVLEDIELTYKSTDNPNFSIIAERFREGLDYKEIRRVSSYFWIKDVTEQTEE
jgi:hypothetical protein